MPDTCGDLGSIPSSMSKAALFGGNSAVDAAAQDPKAKMNVMKPLGVGCPLLGNQGIQL